MANNTKVALLCAYTLAKAKRYGDAEALLLSDNELTKTVEALDLLARIHAERGELAEARRIWQEIQTVHPEHEPSRKALANLGKAPRKNYGKLIAFLTFLLGLLLGFGAGEVLCEKPAESTPEPVVALPEPEASESAFVRWPGIPNAEQFELLKAYRGTVSRVLVSTDFFSAPERLGNRKLLVDYLSEALEVAPGAIFIGGGAAGEPPETIILELD